ncbi:hypothetical protein DFJ58DRAFT_876579 [Suillus subalutaceus]|uniref:uncharacterized protein n=1 Tax=Suillus subalutaceus TaxID=48586 RepID=UPI001B868390|nr:uncharacterized protein DFJ58DRAFT_876579 [Suillus subalutaceus]KAG1858397.1 hypothetical protein DFJ58DRAFT_876579 [Suillus subalutaceus]
MSSTISDATRVLSNTSINSDPRVLRNFQPLTRPILKLAFKVLCVVAVSRTSLDHWGNTKNDEWKDHVTVMINRFQNSNITAGLVLATAALLLVSSSPVTSLMAFDTPASYVFAIIAFSAALLSVISGAAVVVIYETSITHKDMESLRDMPRHQIICLLLWLAYPSICLAVAACSLFASLFIACFCSGNVLVQVITALGCLAFFINGVLTLHVFNFVGRPSAKPVDSERGSASKEVE